MNKHLLSFALLCGAAAAQAQSVATLDAGNIRSSIGTRGYMWNDSATGTPRCEYPKGSGKHVGYTAGLWVGGYDGQAQLKVAGNQYYGGGNDFTAGPYTTGTSLADDALWRIVWRVTRAEVDSAIAAIAIGNMNVPTSIQGWPARGNVDAKGSDGVSALPELLQFNQSFAPFVDANGDGIYNWRNGDVPAMRGDQMTWTVYNDASAPKTATGSAALPVQIAQLSWAFNNTGTRGNIQFYEYTIINRGTTQLDSAVVSVFADMDLGYGFDDHIGFDSARRMGYVYNGASTDGSGQPGAYGTQIPIAGIAVLRTPEDAFGGMPVLPQPLGAFNYFTNGGNPSAGAPSNAVEHYRYMTGRTRAGQPFSRDFTGAANVPTTGYGSGPATKYVFDGDPAVSGTWSECFSNNTPGDRRFILSSRPFQFAAGSTRVVAFALVVAPSAGGCPAVNTTTIRQTADTARAVYSSGFMSVKDVAALATPTIYPNPTTGTLTVSLAGLGSGASLQLVDALGRELAVPSTRTPRGWDVQGDRLPAGIYRVVVRETDGRTSAATFVKQ